MGEIVVAFVAVGGVLVPIAFVIFVIIVIIAAIAVVCCCCGYFCGCYGCYCYLEKCRFIQRLTD